MVRRHLSLAVKVISALLGRGLGAFGQLLLTFILGKLYGADGSGVLMLGVTIVLISSTVGRLGLEYTVLKLTSQAFGQNRNDMYWGVAHQSIRAVAIASALLSVVIYLVSIPVIRFGLEDQRLLSVLPWYLIAMPLLSLTILHGELLKACDRPGLGNLVQTAIIPLGFSAITLLLYENGQQQIVWGAIGYLAATVIALLTGVIAVRLIVTRPNQLAYAEHHELWGPVKSLLWFSTLSILNNWIPLLVLSVLATSEDWGRFSAATRLAMAVSFVLWAANAMVPPRLARMYAAADRRGMQQLATQASLAMTGIAILPVLMLIFCGRWVLGQMGDDFIAGSTALAILAVAQLINVAAGSVDYLLVVTGHELQLRRGATISAIVNVCLCAMLIPWWGINGAAVAALGSIAVERLGYCWSAYRLTGLVTLPIPHRFLTALPVNEGVV